MALGKYNDNITPEGLKKGLIICWLRFKITKISMTSIKKLTLEPRRDIIGTGSKKKNDSMMDILMLRGQVLVTWVKFHNQIEDQKKKKRQEFGRKHKEMIEDALTCI